jgi:hypothetical protein
VVNNVPPIRLLEADEGDLRRLLLRALNENQVLILSNIGERGERVSRILQRISEARGVPLSTLKLNAKILRELRLIHYGTLSEPDEAELTPLGRKVLSVVDEPDHRRISIGFPPERSRCFKPSKAIMSD